MALIVVASPRESAAQVSDAAYADVKEVIEELISQEVAHSLVPRLACYSGRRTSDDPDETTVAVTQNEKTQTVTFEATTHFPRTLQRIYDRQFGNIRGTIREEAASLAAYVLYDALVRPGGADAARPASQLRLTRILGESESAPLNAKGEQVSVAPEKSRIVYPFADGKYDKAEAEWQEQCAASLEKKFEERAFVAPNATPLRRACGAVPRSFECNISQALRATLEGHDAEAEDYLVRSVSSVVARLLSLAMKPKDIALSKEVQDVFFDQVAVLVRAFLSEPRPDLQKLKDDLVAAGQRMFQRAVQGQPGEHEPAWSAAQVRQALDVVELLHTQWLVAKRGSPITKLADFVGVFLENSGSLVAVCKSWDVRACDLVEQFGMKDSLVAKAMPLIEAASRGDYRAVAHRSVDALFSVRRASKELEIYREFASNFVLYVLDIAEGSEPAVATREAFRDSAVDVIEALGEGGGMYRDYWETILLPDLALRASWNAAYVNQTGSAARIVASANWLNFRLPITRRSNYRFVALQWSLIDPLAPLSELATRRNEGILWNDSHLLIANAIAPRFDILVGVPAFSRHLVFAAGASMRAVIPFRDAAADENDLKAYRYYEIFDKDRPGDIGRFVEFGLAAKYLL